MEPAEIQTQGLNLTRLQKFVFWAIGFAGIVCVVVAAILRHTEVGSLSVNEILLHIGSGLMVTSGLSLLFAWLKGPAVETVVIFEKSDIKMFDGLVADTQSELWISGISLGPPLSSFCRRNGFRHVNKNVRIRLLFCHPYSDYAIKRAPFENSNATRMKYDGWLSIAKSCLAVAEYNRRFKDHGGELCVGVLNGPLPATTFKSDKKIVVGHYLPRLQGSRSYRFKVEDKGAGPSAEVVKQLENAFTELWTDPDAYIFVTTHKYPHGSEAQIADDPAGFWKKLGHERKADHLFTTIPEVEALMKQHGEQHIFEKASECLKILFAARASAAMKEKD